MYLENLIVKKFRINRDFKPPDTSGKIARYAFKYIYQVYNITLFFEKKREKNKFNIINK